MSVGRVSVTLSAGASVSAMGASLGSVFEHLAASRGACEHFAEFFPGVLASDGAGGFDLSDDGVDLLFREVVLTSAFRTDDVQAFELNPSDRYLELVAAIVASDGKLDAVVSHGWPVLSTGSDASNVAEGARESTGAPGSVA